MNEIIFKKLTGVWYAVLVRRYLLFLLRAADTITSFSSILFKEFKK